MKTELIRAFGRIRVENPPEPTMTRFFQDVISHEDDTKWSRLVFKDGKSVFIPREFGVFILDTLIDFEDYDEAVCEQRIRDITSAFYASLENKDVWASIAEHAEYEVFHAVRKLSHLQPVLLGRDVQPVEIRSPYGPRYIIGGSGNIASFSLDGWVSGDFSFALGAGAYKEITDASNFHAWAANLLKAQYEEGVNMSTNTNKSIAKSAVVDAAKLSAAKVAVDAFKPSLAKLMREKLGARSMVAKQAVAFLDTELGTGVVIGALAVGLPLTRSFFPATYHAKIDEAQRVLTTRGSMVFMEHFGSVLVEPLTKLLDAIAEEPSQIRVDTSTHNVDEVEVAASAPTAARRRAS